MKIQHVALPMGLFLAVTSFLPIVSCSGKDTASDHSSSGAAGAGDSGGVTVGGGGSETSGGTVSVGDGGNGGAAGGDGTGGSSTAGDGGTSGASNGGAGNGGTGGASNGGAGNGGTSGASNGGASNGGAGGASNGGNGGTTGGHAGNGGNGGSAGSSAGAAGSGGQKSCQGDLDCNGFKCCNHLCVNQQNDIANCGACGTKCEGQDRYCANGTCGTPPCQGTSCAGGTTCCGSQCCGAGKLCCTVNMIQEVTGCFDPVGGTCPAGCAGCACAAPSTPIATPTGERAIVDLKVGDRVYSVDHGRVVAVPIAQVHRQSVTAEHGMARLELESGRSLLLSLQHPTADGRIFADLSTGSQLDGERVLQMAVVKYDQPFTYDILPDSDSKTYFAAGVLIGSTLGKPWSNEQACLSPPAPASRLSDSPGRDGGFVSAD